MHGNEPSGETLGIVGLSEIEERLYKALVEHPATAVADIAAETRLSTRQLSRHLSLLESRGLLRRVGRRPTLYTAMPPNPSLDALILHGEEDLQLARIASAGLMAKFRQSSGGADPGELIETVIGRSNVLRRSQEVESSALRLIRGFDKPPYLEGPEGNATEYALLRSGITVRAVYDLEAVRIPHGSEHIDRRVAAGEHARVAAVPIKLIIADDRLALTTLQGATGPLDRAIVVKPSSLLDALTALFDRTWEQAAPWRTSPSNDAPVIEQQELLNDQRLVELLAAGLTDAAIARQLGVSHRTVQRRVRELLTRLGVETRFQAGIEAARRNWGLPR